MINNPHTQAYLQSLGLEPDKVLQDRWDSEQYQTLERTGFGSVRVIHDWPDNFNAKLFIAFMKKDGLV